MTRPDFLRIARFAEFCKECSKDNPEFEVDKREWDFLCDNILRIFKQFPNMSASIFIKMINNNQG